MTQRWAGRRVTALNAYIIARDHGICWRCGHPGADTTGHIIPKARRPDLMWTPSNLRAEHGARRTLLVDGYDCIGNYAAQDSDAGHLPQASNKLAASNKHRRATRKDREL